MTDPKTAPKREGFDRQDAILALGLVSFLAGIARWSVNGALIALGILCFLAVLMIQRTHNHPEGGKNNGSPLQ